MKNVTVTTIYCGMNRIIWLLLILLIFNALPGNAQEAPLVLVLSSQESEPFVQTRKAFEIKLKQYFPMAEFRYHHAAQGEDIKASRVSSELGEQHPAAIFSLGTRAAEYAQTLFSDYPLVAAMLPNENTIKQKTNHSGILLNFPADIQLLWLSRFLPEAKRVGILYDPALNSDWVKEAEKIAPERGLEIFSFEASSAAKLQSGLKELSKKVDVLLAIPDKTVYSGKTAKQVLLFTYRNRIPFVGLSTPWVKAGALYALGVDYHDLGRQAAELIKNTLEGAPPKTFISYPEKVTYAVNNKSREHLHLEIDSGLMKGASKIFK